MASSSNRRTLALFHLLLLACSTAHGQLMSNYYFDSCLPVENYVRDEMNKALGKDRRMGASILRLFFHDCFVNGCDASVLLDDTETMLGEKNALPNKNSLRGYELIDTIKARLEASCRATVSCADILALAARDAVLLLGGPYWGVPLGRKDARTASQSAANANVPPPFENLPNLISLFASKGLDARDLTALSGAHTIGQARCINFRGHVYDDRNVNASFAALRKGACPTCGSGDDNLAPLDLQTPLFFDNNYYKNLVVRQGLLHSDQELFNGGSQDSLVLTYSNDGPLFARDFAAAMVKMGNISPLTGGAGEIRLNCRRVN